MRCFNGVFFVTGIVRMKVRAAGAVLLLGGDGDGFAPAFFGLFADDVFGYGNTMQVAAIIGGLILLGLILYLNDRRYSRQLDSYRAMEDAGVFTVCADEDFTLIYGNDRFFAINGLTTAQMKKKYENKCARLIHTDDLPIVRKTFADAVASGQKTVRLVTRTSVEGRQKYLLISGRLKRYGMRTVLSAAEVDITDQKANELELAVQKELTDIALAVTRMRVWEYDYESRVMAVTGVSEDNEAYGRKFPDYPECLVYNGIMHPDDLGGFMEEFEKLKAGGKSFKGVYRMKRYHDGAMRYYNIMFSNIFDAAGKPCRAVATSEDVTRRRLEELSNRRELARLAIEAERDSMTGLLNHRTTFERIDDCIASESARAHALVIIDIDHFKAINDRLGHQTGDSVIIRCACTIRSIFRASDIMGRVGGDEFMVLIRDVPSMEFVKERIEELVRALRFSCQGADEGFKVTSTVGGVVFMGETDFEKLYAEADAALYEAKNNGRGRFIIRGNAKPEKDLA